MTDDRNENGTPKPENSSPVIAPTTSIRDIPIAQPQMRVETFAYHGENDKKGKTGE